MRLAHRIAILVAGMAALPAIADTSTFSATKDATLIEEASGAFASGAEDNFWVGRTGQAAGDDKRRGIIAFNLSTIPTGSVVTSVTLTLFCDKTGNGAQNCTVHKCSADWGEGTSVSTMGSGGGGAGGPSTTNSATWIHRFYSGTTWGVAGGAFTAAASATTSVNAQGAFYSWSGAGMVADVQGWVNSSATNFGWILKGNESSDGSSKRFVSRTGAVTANRPVLSVTYTPPTGACCDVNGVCTIKTAAQCAAASSTYQGNSTTCASNPCPTPTGGCCFGNGTCSILTQADCTAATGVYQGNGSDCSPNPCGGSATTTFLASADNTMYESTISDLSNGAGENIIVGTATGGLFPANPARRGLIRFDLSSIPTNAVVSSASLKLFFLSTGDTLTRRVEIVKARSTWGEGTSNASGNETSGAAAAVGDATWDYRFFNTSSWVAAGGDPIGSVSDSVNVAITPNTLYTFTSANVTADVQGWVNTSSSNRGWIIYCTTETTGGTQRIFASRQNPNGHLRPALSVTYSVPQPTGACCIASDGTCSVITQLACIGNGGTYQGDNTDCSPNPCPQPTGGCCLPSGFCFELTAADCALQGGTYNGNNTSCIGVDCPILLTPFVDALPIPSIAVPTTGAPNSTAHYDIEIVQTTHQYHSSLPTSLSWGYEGQVPGPTILARKDRPVTVDWINDLRVRGPGTPFIATHPLNIDTCLHGPDTTGTTPVTVVHLHGAKVAPESDGDPDLAFPPGSASPLYTYPNGQPATTMWYHDHALGITRLNVYMGLAGFYLISDPQEDALVLPRNSFDIPLVIQDRSFEPNGALKYNTSYSDHFFGDFICVNGKVWPFLNVLRGKYRFRLLNGSGSRAYTLSLSNNATFHMIGSDNGLMAAPVALTSITLLPAERADVVIDFQPYAIGTELILTNSAVALFPTGDPSTIVPNVMKFKVVGGGVPHTAPLPATLVPITPIPQSAATPQRSFVLRNFADTVCGHPDGMWLINGLMWDDLTEFPRENATEIWSWVNRSSFTHPMHVHLVRFQVLDRQAFTVVNNVEVPTGPLIPPAPYETGWKDTIQAPPNMITRVIMRFEGFTGIFPFHCHILEHEDHEMMRRFQVVCTADMDDGTGTGTPDGGVGIEDLLFYLSIYDAGDIRADVDDGTATGQQDGGVGIEDLLYYLTHYDAGC